MKFLISVMLIVLSVSAVAQTVSINTDSIQWNAASFYNSSNNERVNHNCQFITANHSIKWIQDNGEDVIVFSIVSKQGSWPNATKNGSFIYNVVWGEMAGTIAFRRESGDLKVSMEFISDGKNSMPYTFFIKDLIKL